MKQDSSKIELNGAGASGDPSVATAKLLRILVVAPSFDILGGQAVQAARLISRLRELPFFEIGFLPINPRLPGGWRKLQAIKYLRTVVTSLLYIATLLARVPRYDVIHVFSASYFSFVLAPTPAVLIAKMFGKKVLLNYHSGEAEDHLTRWRSAAPTIRLADEVAVPSEYLVRVFERFGIQARAIDNLIDLDKFTFRERNSLRPVFLSNRNLETHYGVDHVLRAFALIQAKFPNAELIVAGDGSQRAALERLGKELKLSKTKFIGRIEHEAIVEHYQKANIYLNGSEIDNQPLSILEAFACGLPVITTDAGGIPDMVRDGETGFVVSRGDHRALAARAQQLLETPGLAAAIARNARNECEKYSWQFLQGRWTRLYHELGKQTAREHMYSDTKIGKVRKMTFAELRVRGSQAVAAFAERRGWSSLTRLPSDRALSRMFDPTRLSGEELSTADDFLEHFRTRNEPSFFAAFAEPDAVLRELRNRWPEAEQQIVEQADRIVAGKFDLLGFRDLSFGNPIKWSLEPISNKSAPPLHWSRLDYLDANITGDKKIVWELNRHQYFVKLGQAYWLTANEKYSAVFVAHLNSWMNQNPPKVGINWASSLEVALRSISWLWGLYFFRNSPALDSETFTRALKFLYLNARHLETYLSTYFSPNTHLTGEALGLFYLGRLLPEFHEAAGWRARGQKILLEQLSHQVKPDGVYFEQSSYYHRYTVDFYTHLLILLRQSVPPAEVGIKFTETPGEVEEKLTALLDHLMYLTRPDQTTPLFGDDDGGRLLAFDRRPANDFRAALSNGAALFGRPDYKFVAGELAEETLWLVGPEGVSSFDRTRAEKPAQQSKAFSDGGNYVMRDGWHEQANYLLFDCGPHGADNCGHAHADALAIDMAANGRTMLIDPGTYTYTGSRELRDWFRGSSAHNVLVVDGESSSHPSAPFSWKTIAKCETLSWIGEGRFNYVEGRHDGYARLPQPATHTRSILFLKKDYWVMRDRLSSDGNHDLQLQFHFAAGTNPQIEPLNPGLQGVFESGQAAGLQIVAFGEEGRWSREEASVSHSYGERVVAPVCVFSAKSKGDGELITLLLPNLGKARGAHEVREVEAVGGRAFEITNEDYLDLVVVRDPNGSRVETVRLVSDFNWTWARFSPNRGEVRDELMELLVLDGQRLELDGKETLNSAKRISYLVANRIGNQFRVETSEGLLDLRFPIGDLELLLAESNRRAQPVPPALAGGYNDLKSEI